MHAGKWVAAVLLSVLTGPVSPVLAQSLKDLIQVNKSAGFATGFAPTDAARYEALPEAPRTRSAIPRAMDLSARFPEPGNQGQQSSCAAWSVGYAARSYYMQDKGGDVHPDNIPSPAFIYNTLSGGRCDMATSMETAIELLKTKGAVPLSALPYSDSDCKALVPAPVLAAHASRFRVQGSFKVDGRELRQIKGQIARGHPVIFGIYLPDGFRHYKSGIITNTKPTAEGHGMVITAYDDDRQAFKFINSWGDDWGERGYGWISYAATQALWIEGHVLMVDGAGEIAKPIGTPPAASASALNTGPADAFAASRAAARANSDLQGRAQGSVFRDCADCPEMVVIPAGQFTMGSSPGEAQRLGNEGPTHGVKFSQPFAVGKFEVTFAEWDQCQREGGCAHNPADQGWGRGRQPVINVSWDDAKQYTQWLSKKTGKNYRLLTEAEWEYVARAGIGAPFHFGQTIQPTQANYNATQSYAGGATGVARMQAVAVGQYPANAIGVHDMNGNVYEWTEDCANDGYFGAPNDGSAWLAGDCSRRMMRGGSWMNLPRDLRSAARSPQASGLRYNFLGFRVARD